MSHGSYPSRGSGRGGSRGGSRGGFSGNNSRNFAGSATAGSENYSASTTSAASQHAAKMSLLPDYVTAKRIFCHFHPSVTDYNRDLLGTINSSEENPDGAVFLLIYINNQPDWTSENVIYLRSRLSLLPEYTEKKAALLEQHKEPNHEEMMERISAKLTESIKFDRYGIEDGPDMELFDEKGNITSMIIPGDWMTESHELPKLATVDTSSIKYCPAKHEPIAVFAGYGSAANNTGFKFISWFLIEEIELFAAHSVDLARKMHDKRWNADISRNWAAVKLRRIEKGEPEWRPSPDIPRRQAQSPGSEDTGGNDGLPVEANGNDDEGTH